MRLLPAGSRRMLVELTSLAETQALFASLAADPVEGIDEIVPAARTLLLRFRPGEVPPGDALKAELAARDLSAAPSASGACVEIPVLYDGEDLDEVARLTGLSRGEVVERHLAAHYTVAFTGFAPGFAYLSGGDPKLAVPRRQSPRTRIPAQSVALGGEFCGIYPRASPGGWQILGRTPVPMFDLQRDPAILLQPGVRVRFSRLADEGAFDRAAEAARATAVPSVAVQAKSEEPSLVVEAAPLPALFQDGGRPGLVGQGISASGALDRAALAEANRLVGNAGGEPVLEIAGGGLRFRVLKPVVIAGAGAPAPMEITAASGTIWCEEPGRAIGLDPGDRVRLLPPARGARSYLAVQGGFAVASVFGSASSDTLAAIGPDPVTAGTPLVVRSRRRGAAVADPLVAAVDLPAPGETVVLDIVLGPRTDWFTSDGIRHFLQEEWLVTPRSNRIGLRLAGRQSLERVEPQSELPSEGTVRGSIQVPHEGQPVLFLADHPLTGGYPVIGVVADHHLDLAGQVPVGARIRFAAREPFRELASIQKEPRP